MVTDDTILMGMPSCIYSADRHRLERGDADRDGIGAEGRTPFLVFSSITLFISCAYCSILVLWFYA